MALSISRIITYYHSNYGMQFKKHAVQIVVFYTTLQNTSHGSVNQLGVKSGMY